MEEKRRMRIRTALAGGAVVLLIAAALLLPGFWVASSEKSIETRVWEEDASDRLLTKTETSLAGKLRLLAGDNTVNLILEIPGAEKKTAVIEMILREMEELERNDVFNRTLTGGRTGPPLMASADDVISANDVAAGFVALKSAFSASDGRSFPYYEYEIQIDGGGLRILLDAAEEKILAIALTGDLVNEYAISAEEWLRNGRGERAEFYAETAARNWGSYFGLNAASGAAEIWDDETWESLCREVFREPLPDEPESPGFSRPLLYFTFSDGEGSADFIVRYEKEEGKTAELWFGPA
ncbi:MAG: hypothetical protein IKX85_02325 [Clostridia bacterium]|nr:hypothetical protein [Clostridia bacterium]